jgi:ribonuclease J
MGEGVAMVSITVYDGANGIGGNKIFVEEGGRGVFLDFGRNFGMYGVYYEEFLKNRDTRGIHDLIHLDLVPKLNIYRSDLIPADIDLTPYPHLDIAAVLLSHAHLDHSGNIGLLKKSIPIIASPISLAIMKGMQDAGISNLDNEITYMSPRIPAGDGLILSSDRKSSHEGRNFFCTSTPGSGLLELLAHRPGEGGKGAKQYVPGSCLPLTNADLPFKVSACEVDHSIFGSVGYLLEGDTTLAYTGDFRLHGKLGDKTRDFVHRAKDASVLVIEGTRASRDTGPEGETENQPSSTEKTVHDTCLAAADQATGLIIADFSARNFERLETFLSIAGKTGRNLVVMAKDVYLLHALECADGICRYRPVGIYRELTDQTKRKWETEVVEPNAGEQYVSHTEIRNNPDQYILAFSFFDMKHLLDISPPPGATYIYSSCEAFSEEMEIDFVRLAHWLDRFGIRSFGFSLNDQGKPVFDPAYHASGHASREDLAWVIDQVDPEMIIPVHTLLSAWFVEQFEGVVRVEEGERIQG